MNDVTKTLLSIKAPDTPANRAWNASQASKTMAAIAERKEKQLRPQASTPQKK